MPLFSRRPVRLALAALVLAVALTVGGTIAWGSLAPAPRVPTDAALPGAAEALVLWDLQRAYPATVLPSEGLTEAVAQREALAAFRPESAGDAWEPMGPTNIGGRSLSLAVNQDEPETVWVGSAGGGLWRSYEGGRDGTWRRVETGHPVTAASAVAIAPSDTARVYLGTGEVYRYADAQGGVVNRPTRGSYGLGILRSDDGGATWAPMLDWSRNQERGIQRVRVNPADPDDVWAATTEGVYRTTDGGATWANLHPVVMAMDIVLHPTDPDWAISAHGVQDSAGKGIYRTTDGGATWTQLTDGVPSDFFGKIILDTYPPDPDVVFASVGDGITTSTPTRTWLIRSDDGGDTWTTVSTFDYARFQGWFAHFARVSPHDPRLVFLGGVRLYRSLNGGTSTTGGEADVHSDNHDLAFHPTDPDVAWLAGDGGLYRTDNAGATWQETNTGYTTLQLYNGTSHSATNPLLSLGGAQDNGTWRWTGDSAWDKIFGGDGAWTAIDPVSPNILYYSYQNLNLFRSTSGSQVFIAPPGRNVTAFIAPFVLAPSQPTRIYAGRDIVYRSDNRGSSWTGTNGNRPLDGNAALAMAVSPTDPDVVVATTAPSYASPDPTQRTRVHVSRDAGATWTEITAGLPDRMFMDVAVHPTDSDTYVVVASGFGSGHVFRTTDGGATWDDLTGSLPDCPTSAVAIDPARPGQAEVLYVGNDVGVFSSRDGGQTWAPFNDGLPSAVLVTDLVVSPADGTLRLGTHGNGMFKRPLRVASTASEDGPAPDGLAVEPVAPNPVRGRAAVRFRLAEAGSVRVTVVDARGREVAVLAQGARPAGPHEAALDASALAPGRYTVRVESRGATVTRPLTVVR